MPAGFGALNAQGVWIAGEGDSVDALFSDWHNRGAQSISDVITARVPYVTSSSAARDSYWGIPTTPTARRVLQDRGARTIRTDKGYTEQYFAMVNDPTLGSNPGGQVAAGWYCMGTIHAEYDYSTTMTNATVTAISTPILDASVSSRNASSFFAPQAGGFLLTAPGRYLACATIGVQVPTTGRSFVDLKFGSIWSRTSIATGEDSGSTATISRAAAAAFQTVVMQIFQTTGATRTVTGRISLDYLGPLQ